MSSTKERVVMSVQLELVGRASATLNTVAAKMLHAGPSTSPRTNVDSPTTMATMAALSLTPVLMFQWQTTRECLCQKGVVYPNRTRMNSFILMKCSGRIICAAPRPTVHVCVPVYLLK